MTTTPTDKPDRDEIRIGDVFEITVSVVEVRPNDRVLVTTPTTGYTEVAGYLLQTGRRVARPLQVGDRVLIKGGSRQIGCIAAVKGEMAWVEWPCDGHGVVRLTSLECLPNAKVQP